MLYQITYSILFIFPWLLQQYGIFLSSCDAVTVIACDSMEKMYKTEGTGPMCVQVRYSSSRTRGNKVPIPVNRVFKNEHI